MNGQSAATLTDLLHTDRQLSEMYGRAMGMVGPDTHDLLREAMEDHRRHEDELARAIESAEMQLQEPGEDVKALLADHVKKIASGGEEREILESLLLAERLNALLYEAAERADLPEELSEVITDHHADERMHASLIAQRMPELGHASSHAVSCMTGGMTDDINPDDFD